MFTLDDTTAAETRAPGPLLDVRELSKRFGGVLALDGVSFAVNNGEIFGVIGSNGAGKSTLLGVVAGGHRPTSGTVMLAGETISGLGSARVARRGIGHAQQIPRPFPQMSVRQHADLAARLHIHHRSKRRDHVDRVLDRCGLSAKPERHASELGLLDLKRLEVARALALSPQVLLLDEIAAGLVGREVDDVIALVRSIHADGTTIVMVEHVQALIRELAARVLVLEWGRVLVEGSPGDVSSDPRVIEAYLGRTGPAGTEPATMPRPRQPAPRPEPVLMLERVSVSYGLQPALRDCDLQIGAGEIVAVVGANGAGKTTLSRAIAGMVPSTGGRLTLGGANITSLAAHKRARSGIALCHEGRRLFGEQSVRDNLLIAARRAGRRHRPVDERIAAVLELFPELDALINRRAATLSGGQQQMVAIGRALVLEPRVIIFDELSLGLAPTVVSRLFEALPLLRDRGLAVLLIEQNVVQAMTVADHVYVLDHGVVAFSGAPAEVEGDARLHAAYLGAPGAASQSVISERTSQR